MKWKGTVSHCEKITIDARLATVKTTQAASTQPGWKGQERPAGASGDPASGPRRALLMKGRPAGSGWRRLAGRGWRKPAERGWRKPPGREPRRRLEAGLCELVGGRSGSSPGTGCQRRDSATFLRPAATL